MSKAKGIAPQFCCHYLRKSEVVWSAVNCPKTKLGIGAAATPPSLPALSVYAKERPVNDGTVFHVQAVVGEELAALTKECETVARNFAMNWLENPETILKCIRGN
jgi:hypothetical protein